MKRLFILGLLLCAWPVLAQDYLIFDPPRPSQKFEWLLVVGTTIGEERMFIYTDRYLIKGEDEFFGLEEARISFSTFWIYLQGDWQIFVNGKEAVTLIKQSLGANPQSYEKIPLLDTGETLTVNFKPPSQFLFLKAAAPSPRLRRWSVGEESFYSPQIFFPEGYVAVDMQPKEAKVIVDRTKERKLP